MTRPVYIFDAIRTPRSKGKADGSLHEIKPVNLVTGLLVEMQRRHDLDTARVDDVLEARGRACGRRAMGLSLDNIVVNRQMVGQQVPQRGQIFEFETAWSRADFAPLTTCLQANGQVSGQF